MIESVKKAFQNYANFSGRADRPEYWWFYLVVILGYVLLAVIAFNTGFFFLPLIWILAILIPILSAGVRRMHDIGKSGWFLLIPLYRLILLCTEGDHGPNEYGPDPKGGDGSFDFENNRLSA